MSDITNKIIIAVAGEDLIVNYDDYGLSFDSDEACGIPVVELKPSQLSESALVSQAIKTALKGAAVVLDEIMATPLLTLPKWWGSIKL